MYLCLGVSLESVARRLARLAHLQQRPRATGPSAMAPSRSFVRSPARPLLRRSEGALRHRWRGGRPWSCRSLSRLRLSATPLVGAEAPPFTAKAVSAKEFLDVSLSQYWGEKYVVLFFYPLDFSTICPTEIIGFSDRYSEFASLGAEVLGVSVDSEYAHMAWTDMPRESGGLGNISFPLVSDLRKEIATAYEVLGPDGTAMRALFIIDKEGIIQHSTINNVGFGRNVDEVLRVLQAIQFVQANPEEVCPEGWQPDNRSSDAEEEPEPEKDEGSSPPSPLDLIPDLPDLISEDRAREYRI